MKKPKKPTNLAAKALARPENQPKIIPGKRKYQVDEDDTERQYQEWLDERVKRR